MKLNPRCVTKLPILVNNGQSLTFLAPTGPGTPLLVTDGRVSAPSSVPPPPVGEIATSAAIQEDESASNNGSL